MSTPTLPPVYPRYTINLGTEGKPVLLGRRVSAKRKAEILEWIADMHEAHRDVAFSMVEYTRPPRFRVKVDPASDLPLVIADAHAPHFRGRAKTIEKAMLIIDNRVRAERGMPKRPHFTRAEIREAMSS